MLKFSKEKVAGTVKIEKKLTEDDIATIIVNGFEGGCNYWLGLDNADRTEWIEKPKGEPNSTWATKILLDGGTIHFYDIEDEDEKWELTLKKLIKGYELNTKERPFDSDIKNGDATTADCIIQYALFGELVYG